MGFIITCIYFYLPAAFANVGAFLSRYVPFFNQIKTPVDFGISIDGIRIVGDHKTIGGFIFGVLFGTFVGIIKYVFLDKYMQEYTLLQLDLINNLLLYLLMSFSALTGDILKSVAKRLFNIAPHKAWVPFDEIDHSTLSMAMAMTFYDVSLEVVLTVIIVYFFLHVVANIVGYFLKLKAVPY